MNRKKFLKLSGLGLSSFAMPLIKKEVQKPVVISTWQTGMEVNEAAWKILAANGRALDAVEEGARFMEDKIDCCVGLGGYPDRDGIVTLDACIMDDRSNCGAVAGLEQIRHPISVARKLMEKTPHVILVGNGAQQFAIKNGFKKEPAKLSADAKQTYLRWLKTNEYKPVINIEDRKSGNGPFAPRFFDDGSVNHDTMGLIAMDMNENISGAVTTSGLAFKMHGRVGDSAVIGAGLFVDNEVGAATSSGVGEEVIRICGTHLIVELMRQGYSPEEACKTAIGRIIKHNGAKAKDLQVGFIAINKKGEYGAYSTLDGFVFCVKSNTENMLHTSKFLIH